MGQVAEILSSPEWAAKSALEKAQAQRDLFAVSLRDNPDLAAAWGKADDASKQTLVDGWKDQVRKAYPDAFTTKGFRIESAGDNNLSVRETKAPVYDIATEQIIAAARDPKNRDKFAALPEAQRHALAPFLYERVGMGPGTGSGPESVDTSIFGSPQDFIQKEDSAGAKAAKFGIPALLRLAPPVAASVTRNPKLIMGAAALGDAMAQSSEQLMGTRKDFSPVEMGLNSALSILPAATIGSLSNPALNMATRAAVRGMEGAAQGATFEGVRQIVDEGQLDPTRISATAAFGAGLGGLIGGMEPKIAAMLAGKTSGEALAAIKGAMAKATPEQQAALTAIQKQIEESLNITAPPSAEQTAGRAADVNAALDTADVNTTPGAGDALKQRLAAQETLSAQFAQAKTAEQVDAGAAALQEAKAAQLAGPENVVMAGNPVTAQLAAIETRPGNSARERARLEAQNAPPVVDDGSLPDSTQLSPQAQRVYDEYGFVAPQLASSLAGGTAGAVYGVSTGDDPLDRIKRGATFAVVGAAGGYMLGRRFLTGGNVSKLQPGMTVLADVDRALSPLPEKTFGERAAEIPTKVRTAFTTKFAPLDQLEAQVYEAAGTTRPDLPMSRRFEQVAGAGGSARIDVEDFEAALLPTIQGNERDFDRLLMLKRTGQRLQADATLAAEKARIRSTPAAQRTPDEVATLAQPDDRRRVADWTLPKVDQGLAELESLLGAKRFAELDQAAAGTFQQQMDKNLRLQVKSGRLSVDAYQAIKASNDFYAPFRVMKKLEAIESGNVAPGVDTRKQIVNTISGIDTVEFHIDSPSKIAAENIFNGRVLAEKNMKMLELAKLAGIDKTGQYVRELKGWESPRDGYQTVNFFRDGQALRLEVAPAVASAVKGLNTTETGLFTSFARRFASTFRLGATSANLAFQVRNFSADQLRLATMSKYGVQADPRELYQLPIDFGHGLFSAILHNTVSKETALSREFFQSGAAGSTLQDSIVNMTERTGHDSALTKSQGLARDVIDKMSDLTNIFEQATKMMGFKRGVRIEGIASLPPAQAAEKLAAVVAEVRNFAGSPDFARAGTVAKDMNMMVLFFNARLQGATGDLARLGGADGAKTAAAAWLRLGAAAGIPAAYFWARNHTADNADDFAAVPEWEKNNYEMVPRYDDAGKPLYFTNAQGQKIREYYRIPKRESVQTIANMTHAVLDFSHSKEPAAVQEFAGNLLENVSPVNIQGNSGSERVESVIGGLNPIIKLPFEVTANRDTFRHRAIVPQSKAGGLPTDQQFPGRTPDIYVKAAEVMPQQLFDPLRSPLMLQHIVGGLSGGLITQFTNERTPAQSRDPQAASLAANPVGRIFVRSSQNDSSANDKEVADAKQAVRHRQIELDNAAAAAIDEIKALPAAKRGARVSELLGSRPELAEAMQSELDKRAKGFTNVDRVAITLPVESGARTAYLMTHLKKLAPKERAAYFADQQAKGIITEKVMEQMAEKLGAKVE